jgi:hypothetical protein
MTKQFKTAARRGQAAVPNAVDLPFEFEVTDGQFVPMTAHPPTSGQIALFLSQQAEGGVKSVQALFEFLDAVLDRPDYDLIEEQLHEGLDVGVTVELIEYLIEEWGARPTPPRSGSSRSPKSTGRRSTVKPLNAVSTTSN